MKMLTRWLLATLVACLGCASLSFAQAPIILSSPDAPLVFELPLDASTTQSLTATTTVQLATRAQHQAQGIMYPEWLSDAAFSVNSRPRQRLAIVVTPKRGNPELSTELLMTLNNAGRRSAKPLHLIFDAVNRFEGMPISEVAAAEPLANPTDNKSDAKVLPASVIRFEGEPASAQKPSGAVSTPVPDRTNSTSNSGSNATNTKTQSARTEAQRQRSTANQLAVSGAKPSLQAATQNPAPTSPAPITATAPASIASAAPAATPALPTRSARPMPVPAPQHNQDSWLSDWPLLLGAFALVLALLYLLKRALQSWRTRRADQVQSNFLEPKPTALAPEEAGTNTVFGISEAEADAMHAKWLREQTTKRSG